MMDDSSSISIFVFLESGSNKAPENDIGEIGDARRFPRTV